MARRRQLNVLLRIPDEYRLTGYRDKCDHAVVHAAREPRDRECPRCGARGHIYQRGERKVYHAPINGGPLFVFLEVVRFACPKCRKTWYDGHEQLVSGITPHITRDLAVAILADIVSKMSMAAIAHKEGPSVSICDKVLDAAMFDAAYLPRVLCIDEFEANTDAGKFSVGVADGEGGNLVEILRRPRGDCLDEFFGRFDERQLSAVEFYCCDMGKAFLAAQRKWLPHAKLCIDHFHVSRQVTHAFNKVRARVADMREPDVNAKGEVVMRPKFDADERKKLKKARYLFRMKRPELERIDFDYATDLAERRFRIAGQMPDIDRETLEGLLPKPRAPKCGVVDALLEWDIDLKVAYGLLQAFYTWDAMPWCAAKRDGLEEWCKLAAASPLPEFKTVASTFRKHRTGILNGYKYKKSNATAEGLNNTIKLLKKNAYGFKDFERMRRRCLATLGNYKIIFKAVHLPDAEG